MSIDGDYLFALELQNEFDMETVVPLLEAGTDNIRKRRATDIDLHATQNLVHPEWETIDPTPDINALFGAFNAKFFANKLACVQIEWSKRMYSCAGICYSRKNRLGMSCIIRLSEPLLKLRSRKDLIQTLLHEMIHAFLFVSGIREGNGGHGPNFCKIMNSINRDAGTNITVYHNFYDEVAQYKTHIWRCNGICQHRKPYFGYVKRTNNRSPGPNDLWWAQHQNICGGYFQKISEPDRIDKPRKHNQHINDTSPKINTYFKSSNVKVIKYQPSQKTSTIIKSPSTSVGGNLTNVIGIKDLNETATNTARREQNFGLGVKLGGDNGNDKSNIRNIWSSKYPNTGPKELWKTVDQNDDILIAETVHDVIVLSDDDDSERPVNSKLTADERPANDEIIIKELKDSLDLDDDNDIVLIDSEYDDSYKNKGNIDATITESVVNDIFGSDTLLLARKNNHIQADDIIYCPICEEAILRDQLSEHLNGCTGISIKILPKARNRENPFKRFKTTDETILEEKRGLLEAGYSIDVIEKIFREKEEENKYNARIESEIVDDREQAENNVPCPVCGTLIKESLINEHLDNCLIV